MHYYISMLTHFVDDRHVWCGPGTAAVLCSSVLLWTQPCGSTLSLHSKWPHLKALATLRYHAFPKNLSVEMKVSSKNVFFYEAIALIRENGADKKILISVWESVMHYSLTEDQTGVRLLLAFFWGFNELMFFVFWPILHSSLCVFTGKGAMAEVSTIVETIKQYIQKHPEWPQTKHTRASRRETQGYPHIVIIIIRAISSITFDLDFAIKSWHSTEKQTNVYHLSFFVMVLFITSIEFCSKMYKRLSETDTLHCKK